MGLEHFGQSGIPAEVLPLKTRADASASKLIDQLRSSRVVYFSGGNPAYLARTLSQTPFWSALLEELDRGLAYIGCSAGVACLGEIAPDSSNVELSSDFWTAGLRLFPGIVFGPHWDVLDKYVPDLRAWIIESVPTGCRLVAIDENTAMVCEGHEWQVTGVGEVTIYLAGEVVEHHPSGARFPFTAPQEAGTS
jgi:cyanophycinase